jgi:phage shock protein C
MTSPTGVQPLDGPGEAPGDRSTPLHRSTTNRVFAGVCGGIAEHFGSDPTAVRLAAVVLAIVTGIVPMIVAYVVAAIIIPEGEAAAGPWVRHEHRTFGAGQGALIFGVILILVGTAAFANEWLNVDWDRVWPFILMAGGSALLLVALRRR